MKLKSVFLGIILLMIYQNCFSQKVESSTSSNLHFKTSFSIGPIYPIEFGETALSKAHSANIGFTSTLGLLQYSGFSAGFGLDMISYSVNNKEIIGNFESSKHNSYFFFVNYDYNLTNKFSLTPSIGYGSSELVIKKDGKRRGLQDGKEIRLGTSINYNFNQHNALCFSVIYVNNTYVVNANESIKDYFKKSNSIQIGIIYKTK